MKPNDCQQRAQCYFKALHATMCDLQMITDAKEFFVCSMAAAAKHGEFPIVEELLA